MYYIPAVQLQCCCTSQIKKHNRKSAGAERKAALETYQNHARLGNVQKIMLRSIYVRTVFSSSPKIGSRGGGGGISRDLRQCMICGTFRRGIYDINTAVDPTAAVSVLLCCAVLCCCIISYHACCTAVVPRNQVGVRIHYWCCCRGRATSRTSSYPPV